MARGGATDRAIGFNHPSKDMYSYKYPHPAVTADCIVFGRKEGEAAVLLVQRKHEPCRGQWAFPGGFMNIDEPADAAARRELAEETGLRVDNVRQVGAYTAVNRDPRERVITIAYCAFVEGTPAVAGADDAERAVWFKLSELPPLAFDHAEILRDAVARYGTEA